MDTAVRVHLEAAKARAGPHTLRGPRGLEGSYDGRADGNHAAARRMGAVHGVRSFPGNGERLRVHRLPLDRLPFDLQARYPGMEQNRSEANSGFLQEPLDAGRDR